MAVHPPIMWAQDHEHVFVTIKLQDVQDEEITFHENDFYFKGSTKSPAQNYEITLVLFGEIMHEDEETKYHKFGRYLKINLRKKDANLWWPRLAQTTTKLHNVKIDWEKWKDDSDDEINDGSVPMENTPAEDWTGSDDMDELEEEDKGEEEAEKPKEAEEVKEAEEPKVEEVKEE